jgi:hypothetical protein
VPDPAGSDDRHRPAEYYVFLYRLGRFRMCAPSDEFANIFNFGKKVLNIP